MTIINTNLNLQTMPIAQLKTAKYNPRKDLKPGDSAQDKLKRSLHDFGYVDPIVWNEVTGNIVGGYQRYKVLKAEGANEVDCVVVHIELAMLFPPKVFQTIRLAGCSTLGILSCDLAD